MTPRLAPPAGLDAYVVPLKLDLRFNGVDEDRWDDNKAVAGRPQREGHRGARRRHRRTDACLSVTGARAGGLANNASVKIKLRLLRRRSCRRRRDHRGGLDSSVDTRSHPRRGFGDRGVIR